MTWSVVGCSVIRVGHLYFKVQCFCPKSNEPIKAWLDFVLFVVSLRVWWGSLGPNTVCVYHNTFYFYIDSQMHQNLLSLSLRHRLGMVFFFSPVWNVLFNLIVLLFLLIVLWIFFSFFHFSAFKMFHPLNWINCRLTIESCFNVYT